MHPSHHGFRAKYSTVSALIQMFDSWIEDEDDEVSAVIMLDMSEDFDVADHEILLSELVPKSTTGSSSTNLGERTNTAER